MEKSAAKVIFIFLSYIDYYQFFKNMFSKNTGTSKNIFAVS